MMPVIFGRSTRIFLSMVCMCLFGFGQDRFVSFDTAVFRVSPTNQISAVSLPLEPQWRGESKGSTLPSAAPDGSYIAFIRDYDLWLYDTTSESLREAGMSGTPIQRL